MRSRLWIPVLALLAALGGWALLQQGPSRSLEAPTLGPQVVEPARANPTQVGEAAALQSPAAVALASRHEAAASEAPANATRPGQRFVHLRVLTRDQTPVQGAEVTLFEEPYPSWTARPTEQSDASGRVSFERVMFGSFHMSVRHKGYGGVRLGPLSTAGEHVVVLDPAAQLAVAVMDENGKHLHGVTVQLAAHEHDTLERSETLVSDTRSDGWVRFENLRPGNYAITASPSGAWLSAPQTMWLVPGPNELVVRAETALMAHGIVVSDDAQGTPLAEATLATDTRPLWHPTTGADGRFALPVSGAGVRVVVKAAGHAPLSVQVPALALLPTPRGELPKWRIVVPRETVLTGRVTMRDGFALRAEVICIERHADTSARRIHTGAEGTFALYGLTPNRDAVLVVKSPGLAPLVRAIHTPPAGSSDVGVLTLIERSAQLKVSARDARGRPLAGARVRVQEATPPECAGLDEMQHDQLLDAQGQAYFDSLTPGVTRVQLWPRGSKSPLSQSVELASDQEAQVLFAEEQGAAMQGLVVGPDGKPVHGAGVSVDPVERDPALPHGDSETDGAGAYLVSGLDVTRDYYLTVWPPKAAQGARALRGGVYGPMKPGPDSVRIELEELPWRTLRVRGADGLPIAGVEVEVMPLAGRSKEEQPSNPAIPVGEVLLTDVTGLVRTPWPSDTPMRAIVRQAGRTLATAEIDWSAAADPYPLDVR